MISDWRSDDITFCANTVCTNVECFRHQANMKNPSIPHSVADFTNTDICPNLKARPKE